ncbi:MAG: hypothetical protein IT245_07065 [Bacteroidia bacterium]|nr:hypothetical protein [Bacteroidia bacterium]
MQAVASIVFEPNQYPKAIALIGITTNTIDIITQDGGLVSIYDGQEMCYQNKIDISNEDWFTPLTQGKGYCSCHEKQNNYEKMVCALEWLGYNILETDLRSIYVSNDAMETITPHIINFLKPYQHVNHEHSNN